MKMSPSAFSMTLIITFGCKMVRKKKKDLAFYSNIKPSSFITDLVDSESESCLLSNMSLCNIITINTVDPLKRETVLY